MSNSPYANISNPSPRRVVRRGPFAFKNGYRLKTAGMTMRRSISQKSVIPSSKMRVEYYLSALSGKVACSQSINFSHFFY